MDAVPSGDVLRAEVGFLLTLALLRGKCEEIVGKPMVEMQAGASESSKLLSSRKED